MMLVGERHPNRGRHHHDKHPPFLTGHYDAPRTVPDHHRQLLRRSRHRFEVTSDTIHHWALVLQRTILAALLTVTRFCLDDRPMSPKIDDHRLMILVVPWPSIG